MVQEILVEVEIAEGRRLIEGLAAEGVEVTGAGWVTESEGGIWYLYLASSLVPEEGGTLAAYRRLHEIMDGLPEPLMIGPLCFKVVAPGSPVGKALRALAKRPSVRAAPDSRGGRQSRRPQHRRGLRLSATPCPGRLREGGNDGPLGAVAR